jgi:hypothetical protein
MHVTVAEAKQMECPHRRHCVNHRDVIEDRSPPVYEHSLCLGNGCMAWRWGSFATKHEDSHYQTRGFCGLAGPV